MLSVCIDPVVEIVAPVEPYPPPNVASSVQTKLATVATSPANKVAVKRPLLELKVKLLPDLGAKFPVVVVANKGKHVVSVDSSATVTVVAIEAVPVTSPVKLPVIVPPTFKSSAICKSSWPAVSASLCITGETEAFTCTKSVPPVVASTAIFLSAKVITDFSPKFISSTN